MPSAILARDLMSAPVRTLRPQLSLAEARAQLTRYGHGAMPVVDGAGQLVGIVSRRDLDVAIHHGFAAAPLERFMTEAVLTVAPETPFEAIEQLLVTYDIGRVPVLVGGQLVGIVTRTDLLRQHYQRRLGGLPQFAELKPRLAAALAPAALARLGLVADAAGELGLVAYLVGGAVRDLLLERPMHDLDIVVEAAGGAGGLAAKLAGLLVERIEGLKLEHFARYQTATLTWPDGFALDLATARTEFYARPGASPEVESASIRLDLYRRDFTVNAMAVCLNGPRAWQLIDFFGGAHDLADRRLRVLHPNSFIEDPTRIWRAVRFALRLGFTIDAQTERFIVRSVEGGLHDLYGGDRLKTELIYLLSTPDWLAGLQWLDRLGALRTLHPQLHLDPPLAEALLWLGHLPLRLPDWQLRLERLLLAVGPEASEKLPLDGAVRRRANQVRQVIPDLVSSQDNSPAALHRWLAPLAPEAVALAASLLAPERRAALVAYLECRARPPLLTGDDLKALGLPPGPQFRTLLDAAFAAQLAGQLSDKAAALAWLHRRLAL